jgi:hypothetical protein
LTPHTWILGLVVSLALVGLCESARACGVCVSATEETRQAYYLTTVLMMTVPFALLAGIVIWLRRVLRAPPQS